jgi:hypothetical protein
VAEENDAALTVAALSHVARIAKALGLCVSLQPVRGADLEAGTRSGSASVLE